MLVEEASYLLGKIENIPLGELCPEYDFSQIIRAKGDAGKLLEMALGLSVGNRGIDFEDGELKSNKCDCNGSPLETMFITQISKRIDEILGAEPFENTWLYQKIKKIVYCPIAKYDANPKNWFFFPHYVIDLDAKILRFKGRDLSIGFTLRRQLQEDYDRICQEFSKQLRMPTDMLHTASGQYLQIRTKDTKPYRPIYSKHLGRAVSDKNRAFYFKKEFMLELRRLGRRT